MKGAWKPWLKTWIECPRGLRVWATADQRHDATLKALVVGGVFDYQARDWRVQLQAALKGRLLHAVFDTVSGAPVVSHSSAQSNAWQSAIR